MECPGSENNYVLHKTNDGECKDYAYKCALKTNQHVIFAETKDKCVFFSSEYERQSEYPKSLTSDLPENSNVYVCKRTNIDGDCISYDKFTKDFNALQSANAQEKLASQDAANTEDKQEKTMPPEESIVQHQEIGKPEPVLSFVLSNTTPTLCKCWQIGTNTK